MVPVVDRIADHHVEPRLGGGRADAGRPAHVQVALRDLRRTTGCAPRAACAGSHRGWAGRSRKSACAPRPCPASAGAGAVDDGDAQHRRERGPAAASDDAAMRLPCTSTSPAYGASPLPSKMRTLVNSTSLMVPHAPQRRCEKRRAIRAGIPRPVRSSSSGRSAAAPRRASTSRRGSARPGRAPTCGGATPSSSPVTSSTGSRALRHLGRLRVGQRLAGARVAFGVLRASGFRARRPRPPAGAAGVSVDSAACSSASVMACMPTMPSSRAFAARARMPARAASGGAASGPNSARPRLASARCAARCWQTIVPIEWPIQVACAMPSATAHPQRRRRSTSIDSGPSARAASVPLPGRSTRIDARPRAKRRHQRRQRVGRCRRGRARRTMASPSPSTSTAIRSMRVHAHGSLDAVLERADAVDLDAHHVAVLQPARRARSPCRRRPACRWR